jgi:hypothetical protein
VASLLAIILNGSPAALLAARVLIWSVGPKVSRTPPPTARHKRKSAGETPALQESAPPQTFAPSCYTATEGVMPGPPQPETHAVARRAVSYLELRQWLGTVVTLLPFVLVLGHAFLRAVLLGPPAWRGWDLQDSMSSYYHTDMRNVFVGALCAIGAFLLSYKDEGKKDTRAGTIAGLCAIGAGLFPIKPPNSAMTIIADLHIGFAGVLYLTLAYFAIVRFPVTDGVPDRRVSLRNRLYRICGWTILVCIVLIAVAQLRFVRAHVGSYRPGFWLESLATVAFGISWLTKGEKIPRDADSATQ